MTPYNFSTYKYLKIEVWTKVAPFPKSGHKSVHIYSYTRRLSAFHYLLTFLLRLTTNLTPQQQSPFCSYSFMGCFSTAYINIETEGLGGWSHYKCIVFTCNLSSPALLHIVHATHFLILWNIHVQWTSSILNAKTCHNLIYRFLFN